MSNRAPRVLLDANVLIAALLPSAKPQRTVSQVVERILIDGCIPVIPDELVDEVLASIARKKYLHDRIPISSSMRLVRLLRAVGEPVQAVIDAFPRIVRDEKDDYLIAYAYAERVDYLITYDDDLLSLSLPDGAPRIVSPQTFIDILDRWKQGPPER